MIQGTINAGTSVYHPEHYRERAGKRELLEWWVEFTLTEHYVNIPCVRFENGKRIMQTFPRNELLTNGTYEKIKE